MTTNLLLGRLPHKFSPLKIINFKILHFKGIQFFLSSMTPSVDFLFLCPFVADDEKRRRKYQRHTVKKSNLKVRLKRNLTLTNNEVFFFCSFVQLNMIMHKFANWKWPQILVKSKSFLGIIKANNMHIFIIEFKECWPLDFNDTKWIIIPKTDLWLKN